MRHTNGKGLPDEPEHGFDSDELSELGLSDEFDDDLDDFEYDEAKAVRFVYSPNVRDHFASVALAAILDTNRQSLSLNEAKRHADEWAEVAFTIADAMLARRRPAVDFPDFGADWDEPLNSLD